MRIWQSATLSFLAAAIGSVPLALGGEETAFSWQKPHAKVLPTGGLDWTPEPFVFAAGKTVRYIDFGAGSDASDGASKERPWKHHPWDPAAGSQAKAHRGSTTYVFKRGVVYRGQLAVPAGGQGTTEEPIRLTSDPSWGSGEAVICGSEAVTGWKRGAQHKDIPEPEKVWYTDLDYAPRRVWMLDGEKVTRLKLARTPNWTVSDPDDVKSEWWTWENPQWWKDGGHKTTGPGGRKIHLGIDRQHLFANGRPADYYVGGIVWSEWGIVMGTPFPSRIEKYDPQQEAIAFQGVWFGDSGTIIRNNRYYLEDKPQYLDEPGEFWLDRQGAGGRLYLRLQGDRDPNTVAVEAARRYCLVEDAASAESPPRLDVLKPEQRDALTTAGLRHITISGLAFRFTNAWWDLEFPAWMHKEVDNACIRALGSSEDVRILNCRFEHVGSAVRLDPINDRGRIGSIVVSDNAIEHLDDEAITIARGSGRLGHVAVLRNRLFEIGLRPRRQAHGHAIVVSFPETAEIAGNILDRCYGAGLFIFGGKPSGQPGDAPFSRILIHHNRVTDPLLNTNDWGGIETWQGGPFYVYCNVSGNPGGYWNWAYNPKKPASARFGHAYYLDGSFKNYLFNNIAWGESKDPFSRLGNTAAFQEIISYQNAFFNNTVYNLVKGTRRQAPHAGRDQFLGNVWSGIGEWLFWHAQPANTAAEGNAADAGPQKEDFAYETNAYARNVFHDVSDKLACFEPSGRWHGDLASFRAALEGHKALAADVGAMSEKPVLRDPAKHDFRLVPGSAAVDAGVKVFVPWALYAVVGEWHFTRNHKDPTEVIDEHWYMTPYYGSRDDYWKTPRYPLKAVNAKSEDHVDGPLEDWTAGALRLNGKDQYLVLSQQEIAKPFVFESGRKAMKSWAAVTAPSAVAPGQRCTVELRVPGPAKGQKIGAHLHWAKRAGWGGFNAWGGPAQDLTGEGPYRFTFTPEDKPDLDRFSLLVFLSPTGDWKDKTRDAHVAIDKAAPGAQLKMRTVSVGAGEAPAEHAVPGPEKKTVDIPDTSFLIEVYFRTEPGHTGGTLISKTAERGYELLVDADGRITFMARGEAAASAVTRERVNDGRWHHVIAECDREANALRVYLDGKITAGLRGERVGGSLANSADFLVGKGVKGGYFAGAVDFLRVCRGTLADAHTTIEELYAWQFDGPQFRDFCGHLPAGKGRDAGALELAP